MKGGINLKIFYFTATGNSLYVAKKIGGELYSIPQMIKECKYEFEDDAIGFVFPCHGFGMAKIISNFIKNSKFKADYFFSIMTYGGNAFSGLRHMELVAKKSGINFNYTNEILMVDNFLSAFKMEDEIINKNPEVIDEKLSEIIADITNRRNSLVKKEFHLIFYLNVAVAWQINLAIILRLRDLLLRTIVQAVRYAKRFVLQIILKLITSLSFLINAKYV
ncbi:flavodoxin [Clostridium beijerinckii]|nr:flavodoxin [Clostridium beijerinckii]